MLKIIFFIKYNHSFYILPRYLQLKKNQLMLKKKIDAQLMQYFSATNIYLLMEFLKNPEYHETYEKYIDPDLKLFTISVKAFLQANPSITFCLLRRLLSSLRRINFKVYFSSDSSLIIKHQSISLTGTKKRILLYWEKCTFKKFLTHPCLLLSRMYRALNQGNGRVFDQKVPKFKWDKDGKHFIVLGCQEKGCRLEKYLKWYGFQVYYRPELTASHEIITQNSQKSAWLLIYLRRRYDGIIKLSNFPPQNILNQNNQSSEEIIPQEKVKLDFTKIQTNVESALKSFEFKLIKQSIDQCKQFNKILKLTSQMFKFQI